MFFVCVYEDSVLHMYWCRFQISRSRPLMGKKVKLEKNKIAPRVLYIHVSQYSVISLYRIVFCAIVIQYYTSVNSP